VAAATLAAGAAKRGSQKPATDCFVTATYPDGREEPRECFVLSAEASKPGTKGRFESCTQ